MGHRLKTGKVKLIGFLSPLLAVTGLGFSSLVMAENCAEMPVSGKVYNLVNMGSGKYMDVQSASSANGANIHQWSANGLTNQQFTVTDLNNGYWSIRPLHSNKAVDLYGWSKEDGGTIKQWEYWGGQAQQWTLAKSGAGGIKVASAYTGKLISVANGNSGADVFQKTDGGSNYQIWYFNPVNGSCGASSGSSSTSTSQLIGFASVAGSGLSTTTGGGSAKPTEVSSCDQLATALNSDSPGVIQVPNKALDCRTPNRVQSVCKFTCGNIYEPANPNKTFHWAVQGNDHQARVAACQQIEKGFSYFQFGFKGMENVSLNERRIVVKSNKTLVGLGSESRVIGANFILNGVNNVIIRNLTIENVNPSIIEAGDAISMNNTHHIWLDHLTTRLISDGHVDMYDSKNVTLSWNRFEGDNAYSCGSRDQYVNLIVDSEATYHHNYFRRGNGRNPDVKGQGAKVHLFNNFWNDITRYSIGVADFGQAKVEGNYFENSVKPHWNYKNGLIDANIQSNVYTGLSGTDSFKDTGSNMTWSIPYAYSRGDATQARQAIITGAGPQ